MTTMTTNNARWPFLTETRERIEDAIHAAKCKGEDSACITFNTDAGHIDVWCNWLDYSEVVVCPDNDHERQHPNLERAIFDIIPTWDDVDEPEREEPYSDCVRYYERI